MRRIDWINMGGIAIAIIAGVLYIGEINGRVEGLQAQINQLNTNKIRKEIDDGIRKFKELGMVPTLHPETFAYWGVVSHII